MYNASNKRQSSKREKEYLEYLKLQNKLNEESYTATKNYNMYGEIETVDRRTGFEKLKDIQYLKSELTKQMKKLTDPSVISEIVETSDEATLQFIAQNINEIQQIAKQNYAFGFTKSQFDDILTNLTTKLDETKGVQNLPQKSQFDELKKTILSVDSNTQSTINKQDQAEQRINDIIRMLGNLQNLTNLDLTALQQLDLSGLSALPTRDQYDTIIDEFKQIEKFGSSQAYDRLLQQLNEQLASTQQILSELDQYKKTSAIENEQLRKQMEIYSGAILKAMEENRYDSVRKQMLEELKKMQPDYKKPISELLNLADAFNQYQTAIESLDETKLGENVQFYNDVKDKFAELKEQKFDQFIKNPLEVDYLTFSSEVLKYVNELSNMNRDIRMLKNKQKSEEQILEFLKFISENIEDLSKESEKEPEKELDLEKTVDIPTESKGFEVLKGVKYQANGKGYTNGLPSDFPRSSLFSTNHFSVAPVTLVSNTISDIKKKIPGQSQIDDLEDINRNMTQLIKIFKDQMEKLDDDEYSQFVSEYIKYFPSYDNFEKVLKKLSSYKYKTFDNVIDDLQAEGFKLLTQEAMTNIEREVSGKSFLKKPSGAGLKKYTHRKIIGGKLSSNPKKKFSANILDDEIAINRKLQETPKYMNFGKYLISIPNLMQQRLLLKYPRGSNVKNKEINDKQLSNNVTKLLVDFIFNNIEISNDVQKVITEDEHKFLKQLFYSCNIYNALPDPIVIKEKTPIDKDLDRFEILRGQIIAGNDSKELVKEFKLLLLKLKSNNKINKQQASDILIDLASFGY